MGEIVSWGFFIFFLCLYSYYEEWRLIKKYKVRYLEYYKETGFFIPKILPNKNETLTKINFSKKILITALVLHIFYILIYVYVQTFIGELMIYK